MINNKSNEVESKEGVFKNHISNLYKLFKSKKSEEYKEFKDLLKSDLYIINADISKIEQSETLKKLNENKIKREKIKKAIKRLELIDNIKGLIEPGLGFIPYIFNEDYDKESIDIICTEIGFHTIDNTIDKKDNLYSRIGNFSPNISDKVFIEGGSIICDNNIVIYIDIIKEEYLERARNIDMLLQSNLEDYDIEDGIISNLFYNILNMIL